MSELTNVLLRSFAQSLAVLGVERNIPYSTEEAKRVFLAEYEKSIQTISNDVKESHDAFLGVGGLTESVLKVGIKYEGLRIAKIVLKLK